MADRTQLWVPGKPDDQRRFDRPGLIRYDTISEADPSVRDAAAMLIAKVSSFDREQLLAIIGNVTARLLHDGLSDRALHAQLEHDLVEKRLMYRLVPARRGRPSDQSVIFTRRALLTLGKIALGLKPDRVTSKFADAEVGTCILIINELLEKTDQPGDEALMVDQLANWDLNVTIDPASVIARFRLIFKHLATSQHPQVVKARNRLALETLLFDQLTYGQFQFLLYAVFLIIDGVVGKGDAPVLRLEPPLPKGVGDEKQVRAFFEKRSQPLGDWHDWRYGRWNADQLSTHLRGDFFLHDATTLRRQPFLAVDDLFFLPDYRLALDRMTYGAYWTIFDSLSENDRSVFSAAWGIAFEEYALGLLRDTYPSSSVLANIFTANMKFDGGEIDAVLDFGDHVLLFEIKSTLLPVDVRVSRNFAAFDAWVSRRLCSEAARGALFQLAKSSAAVRTGAIGDARAVIYPVFVTDEIAFGSFGVNRYFNERFRATVTDSSIQPLTVMTTDEFEEVLSCVNDGLVTWRSVLDHRAQDAGGWLWTGQALIARLGLSGNLENVRRNRVLAAEYRAFRDELGVANAPV